MSERVDGTDRRRTAYLIEFRSTPESAAVNASRWLANPGPRRPAHLTLLGPYPAQANPLSAADLDRLRRELVGSAITLTGPARFARSRGATVVLLAKSPLVTSRGHSPGRPYRPHATVYSGPNRALANELLSTLTDVPALTVSVHRIVPVTVGVIDDPLNAQVITEGPVADWLTEAGFDPYDLAAAGRRDRLRAISVIVEHLRDRP
ncbi:MAG: hypothetical protein Q8P61_08955 [Candidatus Nanopelagicales bacterium]|nr:hypothetical protein [Candidatus Nanopelagicales bacterium]